MMIYFCFLDSRRHHDSSSDVDDRANPRNQKPRVKLVPYLTFLDLPLMKL
jgi:hypothetical protein